MLADEDELLHAVAILIVPVATEAWVPVHELLQLILGHGGIPLAGITDADLLTSLFEDVADILFVVEVADALGADDAFGPFAGHELVEKTEIKGTATIVNVGSDAVFLGLAFIVMMMVMMMLMAMMVFMLFVVFIVVVMVMMFMFMFIIVVIII